MSFTCPRTGIWLVSGTARVNDSGATLGIVQITTFFATTIGNPQTADTRTTGYCSPAFAPVALSVVTAGNTMGICVKTQTPATNTMDSAFWTLQPIKVS